MFALWMFGTAVEQIFGWKKFLIFYFFQVLEQLLYNLHFYIFSINTGLTTLIESGISQTDSVSVLSEGKYNTRLVTYFRRSF